MGFRSLVFIRGLVSATCTDFVVESANSLYFLKLNLQRTRARLHKTSVTTTGTRTCTRNLSQLHGIT